MEPPLEILDWILNDHDPPADVGVRLTQWLASSAATVALSPTRTIHCAPLEFVSLLSHQVHAALSRWLPPTPASAAPTETPPATPTPSLNVDDLAAFPPLRSKTAKPPASPTPSSVHDELLVALDRQRPLALLAQLYAFVLLHGLTRQTLSELFFFTSALIRMAPDDNDDTDAIDSVDSTKRTLDALLTSFCHRRFFLNHLIALCHPLFAALGDSACESLALCVRLDTSTQRSFSSSAARLRQRRLHGASHAHLWGELPADVGLPFREDTDSRHRFSTRQLQLYYNNRQRQRDAFYQLLREWCSGAVSQQPTSSSASAMPARVSLWLAALEPANLRWFAAMFVGQLLLTADTNTASSSSTTTPSRDHPSLLPSTTDKLSKLSARLSTPHQKDPTTTPQTRSLKPAQPPHKTTTKHPQHQSSSSSHRDPLLSLQRTNPDKLEKLNKRFHTRGSASSSTSSSSLLGHSTSSSSSASSSAAATPSVSPLVSAFLEHPSLSVCFPAKERFYAEFLLCGNHAALNAFVDAELEETLRALEHTEFGERTGTPLSSASNNDASPTLVASTAVSVPRTLASCVRRARVAAALLALLRSYPNWSLGKVSSAGDTTARPTAALLPSHHLVASLAFDDDNSPNNTPSHVLVATLGACSYLSVFAHDSISRQLPFFQTTLTRLSAIYMAPPACLSPPHRLLLTAILEDTFTLLHVVPDPGMPRNSSAVVSLAPLEQNGGQSSWPPIHDILEESSPVGANLCALLADAHLHALAERNTRSKSADDAAPSTAPQQQTKRRVPITSTTIVPLAAATTIESSTPTTPTTTTTTTTTTATTTTKRQAPKQLRSDVQLSLEYQWFARENADLKQVVDLACRHASRAAAVHAVERCLAMAASDSVKRVYLQTLATEDNDSSNGNTTTPGWHVSDEAMERAREAATHMAVQRAMDNAGDDCEKRACDAVRSLAPPNTGEQTLNAALVMTRKFAADLCAEEIRRLCEKDMPREFTAELERRRRSVANEAAAHAKTRASASGITATTTSTTASTRTVPESDSDVQMAARRRADSLSRMASVSQSAGATVEQLLDMCSHAFTERHEAGESLERVLVTVGKMLSTALHTVPVHLFGHKSGSEASVRCTVMRKCVHLLLVIALLETKAVEKEESETVTSAVFVSDDEEEDETDARDSVPRLRSSVAVGASQAVNIAQLERMVFALLERERVAMEALATTTGASQGRVTAVSVIGANMLGKELVEVHADVLYAGMKALGLVWGVRERREGAREALARLVRVLLQLVRIGCAAVDELERTWLQVLQLAHGSGERPTVDVTSTTAAHLVLEYHRTMRDTRPYHPVQLATVLSAAVHASPRARRAARAGTARLIVT